MPKVTLPDGSVREFESPVSVVEVAADIGPGLAKAALAGIVDGKEVDLSYVMTEDSSLSLLTARDDAGVEVIRHSTAHLLAQAVQRLYPDVQVTIGPTIDYGFYYDFSYEAGFSEDDLTKIEKEMTKIVSEALPITRTEMPRDEAIAFFEAKGESYKAEIIKDIPQGEILSLYQQGDFVDLCRGPHVPDTGKLKAFKLMSVAGAYWRGNSDNEMLQRIYGTAWADKKALRTHLHRLEEAKKRDHRRLGKQMDLFHMQQEAPGMVFWHDKGWRIYTAIQDYLRKKLRKHGYEEINTPQLVDGKP